MEFTLIEGGDLYTPKHAGVQSLLLADGKIAGIGAIVHVFARGRQMMRDGEYVARSRQEQQVESGKE